MHHAQTNRPSSPTAARGPTLACLLLTALVTTTAAAADPKPSPTRAIPAEGLSVYLEYDGLDAHADAWKATAARAMLEGTTAGAMTTELARQVLDRALKQEPFGTFSGADFVAFPDHLTRRGFILGLHEQEGGAASATLVIHGAGLPEARSRFQRLLNELGKVARTRFRDRDVFQITTEATEEPDEKAPDDAKKIPDPVEKPRKVVHEAEKRTGDKDAPGEPKPAPPTPWLSWWYEGEDLILVAGPTETYTSPEAKGDKKPATSHQDLITAALDTIEGKRPDATTHPAYAAARAEGRDLNGFESNGLFFVEPGRQGLISDMLEGLLCSPALLIPDVANLGIPGLPGVARIDPSDVKFLGAPPAAAVPAPAYSVDPPLGPAPSVGPPPAPAPDESSSDDPVPFERSSSPPSIAEVAVPAPPSPVAPVAPPSPIDLKERAAPPQGEEAPKARKAPRPVKDEPDVDPDVMLDEMLGLSGIKRVVGRWGFQGKALVTDVRVEAPGPRKGVVGLFDQPTFRTDRLPTRSPGTGAFAVGSLDLRKSYDKLFELVMTPPLGVGDEMRQFVDQAVEGATGLKLREDLLSHLGPTWCVFEVPDVADRSKSTTPVLLVGVDDPEAFGKVLDALAARANKYLRELESGDGKQGEAAKDADPPMYALERLEGDARGYRLTSPAGLVPWLDDELQPTVLIGKSFVAFAATPAQAREALAWESGAAVPGGPGGDLDRVLKGLPGRLTLLAVGDPDASPWPVALAHLPGTVQTLSGFLGDLEDPEAPSAANFLAVLGLPRPGGFRVRIDPKLIPRADDLRRTLFPSVLAATVDDQGFRLISREAFPFACVGSSMPVKSSIKWSSSSGFKRKLEWSLKLHSGR